MAGAPLLYKDKVILFQDPVGGGFVTRSGRSPVVFPHGRELLELMGRYYAEGKRYRWSVTSPQVEMHGDLGAVVYVNTGSIIEAPGAEPIAMSWLETVLLRRDGARWRVAFLHSTRANAAQRAV